MVLKHPRNIIRDPQKVDQLKQLAEELTAKYLLGLVTQDEYFRRIDEMNEYIDLRRLAAELPASR